MSTARRTPQHRIAETVAGELRDRILAGADRLPTQDQLVTEFGVSYPSVREALRILETEGLVTVRRGSVGGAEVHRPDESWGGDARGRARAGAAASSWSRAMTAMAASGAFSAKAWKRAR